MDSMFDGATYGLEYDCGMFDRKKVLRPELGVYCPEEVSAHSNAGVGADPKIELNLFGGEVQMTPCDSEEKLLSNVMALLDECLHTDDLQFPSSIHVHIRMPKLLERPDLIRKLVHWTTAWWPHFFEEMCGDFELDERDWFYDWWSIFSIGVKEVTYPQSSLDLMDASDTEDPKELGLILHQYPEDWKNDWLDTDSPPPVRRPAVNFGHLFLNETIEFRMFMVSTDENILRNIIAFPRKFITMGLSEDPNPLRILKGVVTNPHYEMGRDMGDVPRVTTQHFQGCNTLKQQMSILLNKGRLTVADLNYPEFWIRRGYQ